MGFRFRNVARSLAPPILWDSTRYVVKMIRQGLRQLAGPTERDASYYDRNYRASDIYARHYSATYYYFLWSVIADRIIRDGVHSVLDIGCGPGQVAKCLKDRGLNRYHGLDLSQEGIEMARATCPEFTFTTGNALETDLYERLDYDAILCLEVLEHVERDIEILKRIRSGAKLYATVPSFPHDAHLRVFSSCDEVRQRYGTMFRDFQVDPILANQKGDTFYLFEGIKE